MITTWNIIFTAKIRVWNWGDWIRARTNNIDNFPRAYSFRYCMNWLRRLQFRMSKGFHRNWYSFENYKRQKQKETEAFFSFEADETACELCSTFFSIHSEILKRKETLESVSKYCVMSFIRMIGPSFKKYNSKMLEGKIIEEVGRFLSFILYRYIQAHFSKKKKEEE